MDTLTIYAMLWVSLEIFDTAFKWNFLAAGGVCLLLAIVMWLAFPHFPEKTQQHKKIILRIRYWLYYALTFFSGARRQIFTVFAAFLMVEKFGYSAAEVTFLFAINYAVNFLFAEKIGRLIHRIGERRALTVEYVGLVIVFVAYGLVENATLAAGLYVIDHMFFAMAIAMKTIFRISPIRVTWLQVLACPSRSITSRQSSSRPRWVWCGYGPTRSCSTSERALRFVPYCLHRIFPGDRRPATRR